MNLRRCALLFSVNMLPLSSLLNPAPSSPPFPQLCDVTSHVRTIADLGLSGRSFLVPEHIKQALELAADYLTSTSTHSTPTAAQQELVAPRYNVKINARTTLDVLYTYGLGASLEYPETSKVGPIGHLFRIDLNSPHVSPARSFLYSQGEPRGSSGKKAVTCDVLVNGKGEKVLCKESHSTCM